MVESRPAAEHRLDARRLQKELNHQRAGVGRRGRARVAVGERREPTGDGLTHPLELTEELDAIDDDLGLERGRIDGVSAVSCGADRAGGDSVTA